MNVEDINYRWIGACWGSITKTMMHWVKAPVPVEVNNAEQDELFTFAGKKKQVYVMTLEDRTTRCILGWAASSERNKACFSKWSMQHLKRLSSSVIYIRRTATWSYTPGLNTSMPDKSETYRVEGLNAELRHYLAA